MDRRQFLSASLAASGAAIAGSVPAHAVPAREYYQIRRYSLMSGPQLKLTENYLASALIPVLTRMGIDRIGAFKVDIGPETPTYYVLIPSGDVAALAGLDLHLAQDEQFLQGCRSILGCARRRAGLSARGVLTSGGV